MIEKIIINVLLKPIKYSNTSQQSRINKTKKNKKHTPAYVSFFTTNFI